MARHTDTHVSLSEFADSSGLTGRHWAVFVCISLVLLSDGMDVTIVSHIFPSLIKEWGVSVGGSIALLVSLGFIAMGLGALVAGRASDRWGRKPVLVSTTIVFAAGTALGATSAGFGTFSFWRLLACLGMGAAMATGNTLLADLMPKRRRSALLAAAYAFVGLGTTVGATLAGSIIPAAGWRMLLVAGGAIPLVIIIVLVVVVPESPRFLAARGEASRAENALGKLAAIRNLDGVDFEADEQDEARGGAWRELFSRRYVLTTILLWVFGFLSLGTQLMVVQYLPTMLQRPEPGLDTVQSSTIVGVYGLASVLGGLLLSAVLSKAPRFITIGITLSMTAVIVLTVGFAPSPGYGMLLVLLTVTGFVLPSACGPTRSVLAAAAYPAAIRGTGVGSTEFGGRIGSAAGGAIGGTLLGAGLGFGGFFLMVLIPIVALIAVLIGLRVDSRRIGEAADPVS